MKNFSLTHPLVEDGQYEIFVKDNLYPLTEREYQKQKEFCELINYWRANPVVFLVDVIGAELLDFQSYAIEGMVRADQSVLALSRNAGKSTIVALITMYLTLLYPNMHVVIASSNGSQSIETFNKIVAIAKKAIPSFKTLTDIYFDEVVKNQARSDGFIRDPSSFHFSLYNGSDVRTVNSNVDGARGKRANVVIFDEAGFVPDLTFSVLEPYAVQNASFKLGSGISEIDILVEPLTLPNKLIYVSSASSVDSYFYRKLKEAWINQMAGNPRYFCINLPADGVIHATKDGTELTEPLLTQETVDSALRNDRPRALKEYYNEFDQEGGEQSVFSRSAIIQNSYPFLPEYSNIDNKSNYAILWDPARRQDNSCCLIARLWEDDTVGWKARLVNCVVLVDKMSQSHNMLSAPQQVEEVQKLLVAYNGKKSACWEHIMHIGVDAGSGGGGTHLTDFLCMGFDMDHVHYKGLIDPDYNDSDLKKFPEADKETLHLVSPKIKADMYEAAIQMVAQGVIEFPEEYMSGGYVDLIYEIDKDGNRKQRFSFPSESEEKNLIKQGGSVEITRYELDPEQERTLTQMNMLKTELVNIWRYKTSTGTSRFDLSPDKANIMHDDRAYCFVMLAKFLSDLRRAPITRRGSVKRDNLVTEYMPIRTGRVNRMIG